MRKERKRLRYSAGLAILFAVLLCVSLRRAPTTGR